MEAPATIERPDLAVVSDTRRRALIMPREHGAWGILLVPLATGIAVGRTHAGRGLPLLPLTIATIALFWARTPLESLLGAGPMRASSHDERRIAARVALAFLSLAATALAVLFRLGGSLQVLWLGAAAGLAFALQGLINKFRRSARLSAQLIGAAGLSVTAPAAYCVAIGKVDATAAALWLLNWMFAANQISFVQLRIHGAKLRPHEKLARGWPFVAGHLAAAIVLGLACYLGLLPWFTLIAFVPVLVRGMIWLAQEPRPLAIHRLGWTELGHAIAFGVLLVTGLLLAH